MKRAIFLNGPPNCGKDTAAWIIANHFEALHLKFAEALKEGSHKLLGLNYTHDFFEAVKDKPNPLFFGFSPREFYIRLSEDFVKPALGEEAFGKILAQRIQAERADLFVISDSGFTAESYPVIKFVDDYILIRIHRPGCDFSNDSRSYWSLEDSTKLRIIENKETIPSFRDEVLAVVQRWLDD